MLCTIFSCCAYSCCLLELLVLGYIYHYLFFPPVGSSVWHFPEALHVTASLLQILTNGDSVVNATNKMQLYRLNCYSYLALHVSGDISAHHQEHFTVFTASDSIHSSRCRLVSWMSRNSTNKMRLYRLIYYSYSALHVSGDVFAHHREHLFVFTAFGSIHSSRCRLVSWMSRNYYQML